MFRPWQISLLAFKPWRLVRELDCYTDRQCRGFMAAVAEWRILLLLVALPVAAIFGLKLMALSEIVNEAMFGRSDWILNSATRSERAIGALYTFSIIAGSATAAFVPYAALLGWIIRRRFNSLACPQCRYSIVGLPVADGRAKCPECGNDIQLKDHGWTADDIIAGKHNSCVTAPQRRCQVRRRSMLQSALIVAIPAVALAAWIATGDRGWGGLFMVTMVIALLAPLPADAKND